MRSAGGAYGPGGQEAFSGRGAWGGCLPRLLVDQSRATAATALRAYDPATMWAPHPSGGAAGLDGNARNARLDKLCFAGGPWTNAPTAGEAVGMTRSTDCAADL